MGALDHVLQREVTICALRSTVFRFFAEGEPFARWWGAGSEVDPRPGGMLRIRYPNGVIASGEVVELCAPELFSFTYGYDGEGKPIPPGGSLVTAELAEQTEGTALTLRHALSTAALRDQHVQGWRYQLALLANTAAQMQHQGVESTVDRFLAAWSEPDQAVRRAALGELATAGVTFRDAFSATRGREDLDVHLAAVRAHMPGLRLERRGAVRHCQGTAIADWGALAADGSERGHGCNVFTLAPDGRIASVVGFWS
jgi:uncharacterized protein YndB with AHSA1/START domain